MDMPLPQRVSSVTGALLPPVLLPMPVESAAGPATINLLPASLAEQAGFLLFRVDSEVGYFKCFRVRMKCAQHDRR